MSGIEVEVDIVKLELGNGIRNTLLVHGSRRLAEGDLGRVRHHVGQRIGLDHDGEGQVAALGHLGSEDVDVLGLVPLKTVLVALQLAGALAATAVPVGQVVQYKTDDLVLARLALPSASRGDGVVNGSQGCNVRDPEEGTELLDVASLAGVDSVAGLLEELVHRLELLGVLWVRGDLLAGEGVGVLLPLLEACPLVGECLNVAGEKRVVHPGKGGRGSQSCGGESDSECLATHDDGTEQK